ncbi:hypothetical protein B1218_38035, partial [Pseudomonas ogarae]
SPLLAEHLAAAHPHTARQLSPPLTTLPALLPAAIRHNTRLPTGRPAEPHLEVRAAIARSTSRTSSANHAVGLADVSRSVTRPPRRDGRKAESCSLTCWCAQLVRRERWQGAVSGSEEAKGLTR